jgi:signal transduction histidine kinase
VVEALNKRGDRLFSYEHQALLIELARWAAIAIQNAHLYEARLREQERRIAAETQGSMAAVTLNMAHTMNNIVGAIRVWAASLVDAVQTAPADPLEHYETKLRQIQGNAEEAITLIRNIRDPLQPVEPGPTDVRVCLTKAIESFWWPDHVSLHESHIQDLPLVWANDKGLEAVFHDLILNAVEALTTVGGGTIQITTNRVHDDRVEIAISDNGPGIPPHLESRIFQPGVSGREGGLGFGLWLAETSIRRFEGQIRFSSSPEEGTTFRVSLRAVNPEN